MVPANSGCSIALACRSQLKNSLPLLQDIAGIDAFATGTALALRLLRPLVLLGAVHLLQFGYSVGSLQASQSSPSCRKTDDCTAFMSLPLGYCQAWPVKPSDHSHLQAQQEEHARLMGSSSQRSHSQRGMLPLLKRFLILHSSKLLAVAAFAAAMQQPGAIGSILVGELWPRVADLLAQSVLVLPHCLLCLTAGGDCSGHCNADTTTRRAPSQVSSPPTAGQHHGCGDCCCCLAPHGILNTGKCHSTGTTCGRHVDWLRVR